MMNWMEFTSPPRRMETPPRLYIEENTKTPDIEALGGISPPPKSSNSPPKSSISPPKSSISPPKSSSLPPKNRILPPKSSISPPKSSSSPLKSRISPPKSIISPPRSSILPPKSSKSPPKSSISPSKISISPPEYRSTLPSPEDEEVELLFRYFTPELYISTLSSLPLQSIESNIPENETKFDRALGTNDWTPDLNPKMEIIRTPPSGLIGNFQRPFFLKIEPDRIETDLMYISCHSLAELIRGEFNNDVEQYLIVDCRTPAGYAAGHIQGAINMHTEEQVENEFIHAENKKYANVSSSDKRIILIFHSESWEDRGPKMYRHLRYHDRCNNPYPTLDYPEMYLLLGGYEEFFDNYKDLCDGGFQFFHIAEDRSNVSESDGSDEGPLDQLKRERFK